jgi:hypothetical protein
VSVWVESACPADSFDDRGLVCFRRPAEVVESPAIDGSAGIAGPGTDVEEDPFPPSPRESED